MNLYQAIAMSSAALLLTSACNSFEAINAANPADEVVQMKTLDNMNLDELLAEKYDKAVLTCSLWLQHGEAIAENIAPVDTFSWDLKAQPTTSFAFELKGKSETQSASVKIELRDAAALPTYTNHVVNERKIYTMQNTVVLNMNSRFNTVVSTDEGAAGSENDGSDFRLGEKVPYSLLNLRFGDLDKPSVGYHSRANCVLETEIKPQYQDQFHVEDVK